MTGRDALSDGRARSRALVPEACPMACAPRGFAITDSACGRAARTCGPRPGIRVRRPGSRAPRGPRARRPCPARGALPLGPVSSAASAQPPAAARAPCLLLADALPAARGA